MTHSNVLSGMKEEMGARRENPCKSTDYEVAVDSPDRRNIFIFLVRQEEI